jgi:hypothetical protein
LFDDIIGASTDEGGVLINLRCGGVSEPDGCADLTGLDDFKQWHGGSPLGCEVK